MPGHIKHVVQVGIRNLRDVREAAGRRPLATSAYASSLLSCLYRLLAHGLTNSLLTPCDFKMPSKVSEMRKGTRLSPVPCRVSVGGNLESIRGVGSLGCPAQSGVVPSAVGYALESGACVGGSGRGVAQKLTRPFADARQDASVDRIGAQETPDHFFLRHHFIQPKLFEFL